MSTTIPPISQTWISSYGQPNASDDSFFNASQVSSISYGSTIVVLVTPAGVATIYSGLADIAAAKAKAADLAAATGIVIS